LCRLLQEYKETDFAPDQEFVPDFIVAQRPKDAPREVRFSNRARA